MAATQEGPDLARSATFCFPTFSPRAIISANALSHLPGCRRIPGVSIRIYLILPEGRCKLRRHAGKGVAMSATRLLLPVVLLLALCLSHAAAPRGSAVPASTPSIPSLALTCRTATRATPPAPPWLTHPPGPALS